MIDFGLELERDYDNDCRNLDDEVVSHFVEEVFG